MRLKASENYCWAQQMVHLYCFSRQMIQKPSFRLLASARRIALQFAGQGPSLPDRFGTFTRPIGPVLIGYHLHYPAPSLTGLRHRMRRNGALREAPKRRSCLVSLCFVPTAESEA